MTSRAALRLVQPSTDCPEAQCASCGERIIFSARNRPQVVIANVYVRGRWDRIEHFHPDCYENAEQPYGEPSPLHQPQFTKTAV